MEWLEIDIRFVLFRDYFSAVFGPLSVVLVAFTAEQLFEYFYPYVSPRGIDGIVYLWLHTLSLFFILSFASVMLLRSLSVIRKYLKIPWDMITPPFSRSIERTRVEINHSITKRAKILSLYGIGFGSYFTFLLQFIGFVPYRMGMVLTGPLGRSAPNINVPNMILEWPIISDLTFIGGYVASPNAFGYILISIVLAPMVIGFWNLTYVFFNHRRIRNEAPNTISQYSVLFRVMPYIGLVECLAITWEFGLFWFFH
jgi:hypothetical protein